jgi:hypothetical protein
MSTDQRHLHDADDPAEHDYERLVGEDSAAWSHRPDPSPLVATGTALLRRRRRRVAGGAAGLVAAAVAVPVLALQGGTADPADPRPTATSTVPVAGTDSGPDDAPPPDPVTMRGCGWFACAPGDTEVDTQPVQGEVLRIGRTRSGLDEVVWASERLVTDPSTGQDVTGTALMTGFVRGDARVEGVFALQPGHEFAPDCVGSFFTAATPDGGWAVLGYVEGEAAEVTYTGGSGDGAVQSSTTVLPGSTVFVAHGPGTAVGDYPTSFTAGGTTAPLAGCTITG